MRFAFLSVALLCTSCQLVMGWEETDVADDLFEAPYGDTGGAAGSTGTDGAAGSVEDDAGVVMPDVDAGTDADAATTVCGLEAGTYEAWGRDAEACDCERPTEEVMCGPMGVEGTSCGVVPDLCGGFYLCQGYRSCGYGPEWKCVADDWFEGHYIGHCCRRILASDYCTKENCHMFIPAEDNCGDKIDCSSWCD